MSSKSLWQPSFNVSELERRAVAIFLESFCVHSENKALSRGYLDNLGYLFTCSESSSDLAKAAKVTALAHLGNKIGEPGLIHRARLSYLDLLVSFKVTMSNPATASTIESLAAAVLLGLYEVGLRKH